MKLLAKSRKGQQFLTPMRDVKSLEATFGGLLDIAMDIVADVKRSLITTHLR